MSVIVDVIQEELNRLHSLVELYDKKIARFPKGSISEKTRGNREYCYLAYRIGRNVRFEYIGSQDSERVKEIREKIEQRKMYEERRREALKNLKQVEKLINVSK